MIYAGFPHIFEQRKGEGVAPAFPVFFGGMKYA